MWTWTWKWFSPLCIYPILLYAIQFKGLPRQTSFRCPTKYYKRKRTPFGGALHWAISIFKFFLSFFFCKILRIFLIFSPQHICNIDIYSSIYVVSFFNNYWQYGKNISILLIILKDLFCSIIDICVNRIVDETSTKWSLVQ